MIVAHCHKCGARCLSGHGASQVICNVCDPQRGTERVDPVPAPSVTSPMEDLTERFCAFLRDEMEKAVADNSTGTQRAITGISLNFLRIRAEVRIGATMADWRADLLTHEEAMNRLRSIKHGLKQEDMQLPDCYAHNEQAVHSRLLRDGRNGRWGDKSFSDVVMTYIDNMPEEAQQKVLEALEAHGMDTQ